MFLTVEPTNRTPSVGGGYLDNSFTFASVSDETGPVNVTVTPPQVFAGAGVITCNMNQDGVIYYCGDSYGGSGDGFPISSWQYTANTSPVIPVEFQLLPWYVYFAYAGTDSLTGMLSALCHVPGAS